MDTGHSYWITNANETELSRNEAFLLRLRTAAATGDFDAVRQLVKNSPDGCNRDPAVVGTMAWVELLDGRSGIHNVHLDTLRQAALSERPPSPYLQSLLVRALALTDRADEAEERLAELERNWPENPDVTMARAAVAQVRRRYADALADFQQLRNRFARRSFTALTHEMILATWQRDIGAFKNAYVERARLREGRAYPGVPFAWLHLRWMLPILLTLWAIGLLLGNSIAQGIAILGLTALVPLHWHVLRKQRLLWKFSLLPIVPLLISATIGIWYPR